MNHPGKIPAEDNKTGLSDISWGAGVGDEDPEWISRMIRYGGWGTTLI